eukprot:TCONS_00066803-protein
MNFKNPDMNKFSEIIYVVRIKRKPLFLITSLIMPKFGITLISLLAHVIPAASGERILMLIDLMLVLALFLTNVMDIIPGAAGEVPFFTYFLLLTLIGMVTNIVTMVYTLSIYFANCTVLEMPRWLRYYVLDHLAPSMGYRDRYTTPKWMIKLMAIEEHCQRNQQQNPINSILGKRHPGRLWGATELRSNVIEIVDDLSQGHSLSSLNLCLLSQKLSLILDWLKEEERKRILKDDWLLVAKALDQVTLYINCSILATVIFWFFYKAYSCSLVN